MPSLQQFKESLTMHASGRSPTESRQVGECVNRGKVPNPGHLTEQDLIEMGISGICPECCEKTFGCH